MIMDLCGGKIYTFLKTHEGLYMVALFRDKFACFPLFVTYML